MLDSHIPPLPAFADIHFFAPSLFSLRLCVNPLHNLAACALNQSERGSRKDAKKKEGAKKIWGAARA